MAVLLSAAALIAPSHGGAATGSCAVPKRPSLCHAFAVLRRPARSYDRLPRRVRDDPPIRQTDPGGSRRLLSGHPKGYRLYVAAGHRMVCLVIDSGDETGFACNPPDRALRGGTYLEESCAPGARRHRVLVVELIPDGVHSVTVHRTGRPAVKRRVEHNTLVADLAVPATGYIPSAIEWKLRGEQHTLPLDSHDDVVTCRAPSGWQNPRK